MIREDYALKKALGTILPPMVYEEIVEVSKIYSIAGNSQKDHPLITEDRFVDCIIRLLLFLLSVVVEIPNLVRYRSLTNESSFSRWDASNFHRPFSKLLRQPLEDWVISINRVQNSCIYPARFMLVGAMNPCPCGFMGDPTKMYMSAISDRSISLETFWSTFDRIDILSMYHESMSMI